MTRRTRLVYLFLGLAIAAGFILWPLHTPLKSPAWKTLGELPVKEAGRIKPLDSVARNTLLSLSGRQTLPGPNGTLSALEWLMAANITPEEADTWPVFLIRNNPPLLSFLSLETTGKSRFSFRELAPKLTAIEEQAKLAQTLESYQRSPFQRSVITLHQQLTRYLQLKNSFGLGDNFPFTQTILRYDKLMPAAEKALTNSAELTQTEAENLRQLFVLLQVSEYLHQTALILPIPPNPPFAKEWETMGGAMINAFRTHRMNPALFAWSDFIEKYQSGNETVWSPAISAYQEWLSSRYPAIARKAALEAVFNRLEPFYSAMLLYVLAAVLIVIGWAGAGRFLLPLAYSVGGVTFLIHTASLGFRIWLLGRPPVTNLYSSAIFVGWIAVLLGLLLEKRLKNGIILLAGCITGSITLLIAHHLATMGETMEVMQAVLDSNFWLSTHVITITIGYAGAIVAGTTAILYILLGIFTRKLTPELKKSLTGLIFGTLCFTLFFAFVGTVLGGIWADQSWGRFWGWDPKENGALMIVLWVAIVLHARLGGLIRKKGLVLMTVFGNMVVAFSWFGVNMLGVGLHSYGFMERGVFWLSTFMISQVVILLIGILPHRK